MSKANLNREAWLSTLADKMTPILATHGIKVPEKLRVSCGFPRGQRSVIGQCWHPRASKDKTTEVFVSPTLDDPERVADVLAHELIHASGIMGHGKDFADLARAIGLDGKPTATFAGEGFKQWALPILAKLPDYPHGQLSESVDEWRKLRPGETPSWGGPPKQSTRLLKVGCEEGHDPYLARMTRKALNFGLPKCPCGAEMQEMP